MASFKGARRLCALVLIALSAAGCSETDRKPDPFLESDEFANFLLDATLIEALDGQKRILRIDTAQLSKDERYRAVLQRQGLSAAEMQAIFAWYREHSEELEKAYDLAIDSLTRMEVRLREQRDSAAVNAGELPAGDSLVHDTTGKAMPYRTE